MIPLLIQLYQQKLWVFLGNQSFILIPCCNKLTPCYDILTPYCSKLQHSNSCKTTFSYALARLFIIKLLEFPQGSIVHRLLQAFFCSVIRIYSQNKDLSKQHLLEKINNTFRYLDFNIYTKNIYPVELSFNKANIDNKECLSLDLIQIMVDLRLKL